MRIDKVYIEDFRNLKEFEIDLDQNEMKTVLLGQNATGKSNFLEAIILIFKCLDLSKPSSRLTPGFSYNIIYKTKEYVVEITHNSKPDVDKEEVDYLTQVNGQKQTFKSFFSDKGKKDFQPKNVFTYYSGVSNKLRELFWDHQENFYDKIIKEDFDDNQLDSLRKLFYVQLVHSYFVLLAYFSFEKEEHESVEFLEKVFGIKDLESVLFVLKKPDWSKERLKKKPNDIFWTAAGLVRKFLDILWEYSLAPIYSSETIQTDFRSNETQDRLYLYIKDKEQLKKLAENYETNTGFFKALESTYISKLIAEVRIKVKKENVDGTITFKDLSEGEQQLLTVLGLLKFTKDEESLVLLDEPDTHLNPVWKWQYLEFLENVVKRPESTQIIINTHDPLVIGSLRKEEVRIFRNDKEGKIYTEEPDIDPRGLGVDGILTSELFGLPTTLDEETLTKLDRRNELLLKQQKSDLTEAEENKLNSLYHELDQLGFSSTFRDPLYQKFIVAYKEKLKITSKQSYTKEEIDAQNSLALEILEEINKEEDDSH